MRAPAIILIAAAFLGGCFYSEDALISRGQADFPLEEGIYSHTPYLTDGVTPFDRPAWTGEIEHSWGRYVSDDDSFPHEGVRLKEIADGLYIAQKRDEENWSYGLLRVYPGGVATYHAPECRNVEAIVLERYDVTEHVEERGYCRVDDWDRLVGVMLSYVDAMGEDMPIDGVYRRVE